MSFIELGNRDESSVCRSGKTSHRARWLPAPCSPSVVHLSAVPPAQSSLHAPALTRGAASRAFGSAVTAAECTDWQKHGWRLFPLPADWGAVLLSCAIPNTSCFPGWGRTQSGAQPAELEPFSGRKKVSVPPGRAWRLRSGPSFYQGMQTIFLQA